MNTSIYDKYEYMDQKQIFAALLNAEKKFNKLKNELENQKTLIKFLKAKSKKINDKSYKLAQAPSIKNLDKEFEKLPQDEQEQIIAEIKAQMGI